MSKLSTTRRGALQALTAMGATAPIAINLAAASSASAATQAGYKALICLYLGGGNDSINLVVPTDDVSWKLYWAARNVAPDPIALMPPGTPPVNIGETSTVTNRMVANRSNPEFWGGVLPIVPATPQTVPGGPAESVRTFGVHPLMPKTKALFDAGRLAFLANIGTKVAPISVDQYRKGVDSRLLPKALYSHSDQSYQWTVESVSGLGFGGLIEDYLVDWGVDNSVRFATLAIAGGQSYLTGRTVRPFSLGYNGTGVYSPTLSLANPTIGSNGQNVSGLVTFVASYDSSVSTVLLANNLSRAAGDAYNPIAEYYQQQMGFAKTDPGMFTTAVTQTKANVPMPPAYTNPTTGTVQTNELALQLLAVAQTIAAKGNIGVQRQVFYVSIGSWDTHDRQNTQQGMLLSKVDHALAYFNSVMDTLGVSESVTLYTASDFGRTFDSNGDGTDHGWGSNQIVMGGAVKGGDIYGRFADFTADRIGRALFPNLSVDQCISTLAQWMGVEEGALLRVLPNLGSLAEAGGTNLGFMKS